MKLTRFIKKNLTNLTILAPLLLLEQDVTRIIFIVILIIYLQKSDNIFKRLFCKFFKNKKYSDEINELDNNIFNEINECNHKDTNNNNDNCVNNDNNCNNDNSDNNDNKHENKHENKCDKRAQTEITVHLDDNEHLIKIDNINKRIKSKKNKHFCNIQESITRLDNKSMIKKTLCTKPDNHEFVLNVNQAICSTPIFTLRTYNEIDFYFNFVIHDFDSKKIHNLIMCKDINKWMNTSSISDQDISDELIPIYFCIRKNDKIEVFEYLKIFIDSNEDGKIAFIQKDNDYHLIENYIKELINKNIIFDLLDNKTYTSYNLSTNDGVCDFLNKFLSLVLISENSIGQQVKLDIENYHNNKSTYEFFLNTVNSDSTMFNTTI
jgi:hypothetical protein